MSEYLTRRAKAADGKSIVDATELTYRNASGKDVPYKLKDIEYDIKCGYLRKSADDGVSDSQMPEAASPDAADKEADTATRRRPAKRKTVEISDDDDDEFEASDDEESDGEYVAPKGSSSRPAARTTTATTTTAAAASEAEKVCSPGFAFQFCAVVTEAVAGCN